jgi:hypothetical protein
LLHSFQKSTTSLRSELLHAGTSTWLFRYFDQTIAEN